MRLALLCLLCLGAATSFSMTPERRVFNFTYELLEQDLPVDKAVDIYIPMPSEGPGQRIVSQLLESSIAGVAGVETAHGNAYYHLHRPVGSRAPLSATLRWTIVRDAIGSFGKGSISQAERLAALAPDALVPVGHAILQPILTEIRQQRADDSHAATARAIYDWVVDNVEYKKVGTGWGNGDTFWACSERYGNCTDFHALFIALARTEGIPARFEIGFPIPNDRTKGQVGGYHCWVQFYLPERGWIPIDASEAAKHPEQREMLYGGQPADRIHFSTGRDLVMSEATVAAPLNYFIYPYVEVAGKPWVGKVATRFYFEQVSIPVTDL